MTLNSKLARFLPFITGGMRQCTTERSRAQYYFFFGGEFYMCRHAINLQLLHVQLGRILFESLFLFW